MISTTITYRAMFKPFAGYPFTGHKHSRCVLLPVAALMALVLALAGCAQLQQHAETIKPTAKLTGASLTNISFDQADLLFDLAVENRNPVALDLSGLDYDFMIEGQSMVSGVTAEAIKLKANGTSQVQLPVSLKFDDLRQLGKKLGEDIWNKDRLQYDLQTTFRINLPVIGDYAIPVSKQGEVPVPKMPVIKFKGVKLKEMGFTSASVLAQVEVSNPNDFILGLKQLSYDLNINQAKWGSGQIEQATSIPEKGKAIIGIPLQLDLLSMGTAALTLLKDKPDLDYHLTGDATIDTGLELLKGVNVPLDLKGTTAIR